MSLAIECLIKRALSAQREHQSLIISSTISIMRRLRLIRNLHAELAQIVALLSRPEHHLHMHGCRDEDEEALNKISEADDSGSPLELHGDPVLRRRRTRRR